MAKSLREYRAESYGQGYQDALRDVRRELEAGDVEAVEAWLTSNITLDKPTVR